MKLQCKLGLWSSSMLFHFFDIWIMDRISQFFPLPVCFIFFFWSMIYTGWGDKVWREKSEKKHDKYKSNQYVLLGFFLLSYIACYDYWWSLMNEWIYIIWLVWLIYASFEYRQLSSLLLFLEHWNWPLKK